MEILLGTISMQYTVRPAVILKTFYLVFLIHLTLPELTLPLILFYRNCINRILMLKICGTLRKKAIRLVQFKCTFQVLC